MSEAAIPLLEVRSVSKGFPGVRALDGVGLEIWSGEVHCLLGENGAGKSTLLRILAGLMEPDSGEIVLRGERIRLQSPNEASGHGIAMIHQELMPFPEMSVAENIYMGREPLGAFPGWVDRSRMEKDARSVLAALGVDIDPGRLMRGLSVSETQMIEIAKAVARKATLIIMDEPTSSLSHREAEALFRLIADLKSKGAAVVYVSHKMDEIFRLGDRVTVLRDGRRVDTGLLRQFDEAALVSRMVGRPVAVKRRDPAPIGEEVLAVEGLGRDGRFSDVSFRLRRGEVLGFAGLMGAGRTEVMSAIFGIEPADRGTIAVRGRIVQIDGPKDALGHKIGFVSEDRKQIGLVLGSSVVHNVTIGNLQRCCSRGIIRSAAESQAADENIRRYGIKVSDRNQQVGTLSGGNQQKVVMAKVLFGEPEILILDEPTRGIDIGAKQEIYALIAAWALQGLAVILVSSELSELIALSDRILVMRGGRLAAELPGGASQEEILRHAMPN